MVGRMAYDVPRRRPDRDELTVAERRELDRVIRKAREAEHNAELASWQRDRVLADLQDSGIKLSAIAEVMGETREMVRQRALRGRGPRPR